jgi:hypothetical protein
MSFMYSAADAAGDGVVRPHGLIGMFRNAVDAVEPVAALNNYLLPVWMVAFGIGLLRAGVRSSPILAHTGGTVPVVTP